MLLDNGRSRMMGSAFQEMLRCIRCGACMNHCPVYLAAGGHAYGWVYVGPMGSVLTPQFVGIEQGHALPNASTFCGRCEEVCPVRIPLPRLMRLWREEQFRRGLNPPMVRWGLACLVLPAHRPPGWRRGWRPRACAGSRMDEAGSSPGAAGRRLDAHARHASTAGQDLHGAMARPPEPQAVTEARDAILAGLRRAIGRTEPEQTRAQTAVRERLASPAPNLLPERGQLDAEGRIGLFTDMARAVNTDVQRLARLDELPAAVTTYLRQHNLPQRLVAAPDAILDQARWESAPLLRVRRGAAAPEDTVALTLAPAAVAETGTLMLVSSPERPALLAFLPETSIVVVFAADVDGAYEQSWARLREALGAPPRAVNFVTGPSRTGDIAQKIELGAHGPRRLLVLIVDEDPA